MTGAAIPRLRMFAGPNGSGKSRIKSVLRPELLGEYINPDDIERDIRQNGFFSLSGLEVQTKGEELELFFAASPHRRFCSAPICGAKHKSYALATGNSGSMR